MQTLELRIPPPVVGLLTAAAMWGLSRVTPRIPFDDRLRVGLAAFVLLVGIAFAVAGLHAFRRAKTTVNPLRPEATSALVVAGVYRYTRNPMYVGLALVLLAWAIHLAAPWALVGPLVFVAWITRFQILPEERVLSRMFGSAFDSYRQRVRRWL
jgi:protein-S-isoprenylcysteine O-methyltransferase Ste14